MIKQISDHHGGDNVEWLREYAKEVIERGKDDFSATIECFEDLVSQLKYVTRKGST